MSGEPEQLSRRRLSQPVARTRGHKSHADPAATPGLDGRRRDAARGAGSAPRNISRGSGPGLGRGRRSA